MNKERLANLGWTGSLNSPDLLSILPDHARIVIKSNAIQIATTIIQPNGTPADDAVVEMTAAAMLIALDRFHDNEGNATPQDVVTLLDTVRERFSKGMSL